MPLQSLRGAFFVIIPHFCQKFAIMFACLPYDIIWLILHEFVKFDHAKGLSTLDVAFCNHSMRSDILRYLTQCNPKQLGYGASFAHVGEYLNWLTIRNVPGMSELDVRPADIPNIVQHLTRPMPQITKLSFNDKLPLSCDVITSIAAFIACFPALAEIECGIRCADVMSDHHLKEFVHMRCPLKTLTVVSCSKVSASMLSLVISAVASTLQELTCDALDDTSLDCLARELKNLRTLSLGCDHIQSLSSLQQFLQCVSSSLTSLTIFHIDHQFGAPFNDAHIEIITAAAARLKYISVGDYEDVDVPALTAMSLQYTLANNPNMKHVTLRGTKINVKQRHNNGDVIVELRCGQYDGGNEFIAGFCSVDHLMVQSLLECWDGEGYSSTTLRLIGNRWGKELKEFECLFDDSVLDADFQHFLLCCPAIISMDLSHSTSISDNGLAMLPMFCCKLEVLEINAFDLLTNDGMRRILQGYQRFNTLKELSLYNCHLGVQTLEYIAENCPQLRVLRLIDVNICEEDVETLINEGKLPMVEKYECSRVD